MKKYIKRTISLLIIFSALLSLMSIVSFADDTTEEEVYESCLEHYFDKLEDGFSKNVIGSCGYVAMSLFLNYYDTYWNDNFVADVYENRVDYRSTLKFLSSPAGENENDLWDAIWDTYVAENYRPEEWESFEAFRELLYPLFVKNHYPDFVEDHQGEGYLHLDLIGLGIEKGYYDGIFADDEYSTSLSETAEIFEEYFKAIFGDYNYYDTWLDFEGDDDPPIIIHVMTESDFTSEEIKEKMYELLEQNIPVMYGGARTKTEKSTETEKGKESKSRHRLIAYNVTKNENTGEVVDFKMHTGWFGEESSKRNSESLEYTEDIGILWLEIDEERIPHVCCDKYMTLSGRNVCSCDAYGTLHPEHEHKPYNGNEMCPAADPTTRCICGEFVQNTHIYNNVNYDADYHWEECECGNKQSIEQHVLSYSNIQSETHTLSCFCGYSQTEHHDRKNCYSISNVMHTATCSCGRTYSEQHNFEKKSARYSVCMNCGYTRDHFGGNENVHLGTKEDEETE